MQINNLILSENAFEVIDGTSYAIINNFDKLRKRIKEELEYLESKPDVTSISINADAEFYEEDGTLVSCLKSPVIRISKFSGAWLTCYSKYDDSIKVESDITEL